MSGGTSGDRHAEHARIAPDRYGGPLARPAHSPPGRLLVLVAGLAVVVVLVLVVVLVSAR
jgi:hypothetical protein